MGLKSLDFLVYTGITERAFCSGGLITTGIRKLGGSGGMLPWKFLKTRPSKTAISCIFRRSAGVTSGVSRSQISSFRREIHHSGTLSSGHRIERVRLKSLDFLVYTGTAMRVLKWGLYNKRVSIRKLGRSGGMFPRENVEIWVPQISGNAGRSYANEMLL